MDVELETYGCSMNKADSEFMAGLLADAGFTVAEKGNVIVVNTCSVKTPTENKIIKRLSALASEKKKVVVAGCMPASLPYLTSMFPCFSFIGTNVFDVVEAVKAACDGRRFVKITESNEKVCIPRVRENPLVEIVPIAEGCVGECNYCITKKARGTLKSYAPEKIVAQVRTAVRDGVKEVWITAQDTGAYGLDSGSSLPEVLNEVCSVDGSFKVRVGMMNPSHVSDFIDDLIGAYSNDKVYKFLHLPVQSGDNGVLDDMNRQYTVEDFKRIVNAFRKAFDATISTDVIVGYPTENERAFKNSVKLMEETKPDVLNISRYWSRPGTKANMLKQHPGRITKARSRLMNDLFREIGLERNRRWVGWSGTAVVSEKTPDNGFCARNDFYKPIVLKSDKNIFGRRVDVKVVGCTYYDLRAEIV